MVDAPDRSRFEALEQEQVVGVLDYRRTSATIVFDHVEVELAFRGRGIAGQIVTAAVAAAEADGLEVIPVCPYVVSWMRSRG